MTRVELAPVDAEALKPILAIDLGGTQIRAAYVSPDLVVSARRAIPTRDEDGPDVVIERICELADQVRGASGAERLAEPVGIGISAPGPLNPWLGVVVSPPNLQGWRDVPLADRVEAALGMPTFLERDTNVAVMAEWRHGAARNADDVVYITVSTGIGGGIILGGRPIYGLDGTAGEVGHVTVALDGPLCGDGMPGHVEAIGSGTAIAREGRSLLDRGEAPVLARLARDAASVDAALVAEAADQGDMACRAVYERAYVAVGALCASLVMVLNPQVIVIGGSVAEHRPELIGAVRREIDRRAYPGPARRARLTPARFSDDVSLIGSLPIVNERLTDPAYRRTAIGGPAAAQAAAPNGGT
jgi:glucokinase